MQVDLGEPFLGIGLSDVLGIDVAGVMDWTTCQPCHELIQTGGELHTAALTLKVS